MSLFEFWGSHRAEFAALLAQHLFLVVVSAWPAVVPPESVSADASLLYSGAARIEIAALGVK